MKYAKQLFILCVVFLFHISAAFAGQRVVELEKCPCTSDQESRNRSVLERVMGSDTLVQLPEGTFSMGPLSLDGFSNLTVRGTADPDTGETQTRIKIMKPTGMALSNTSNLKLTDLEIQGLSTSELVVVSEGGDMSASNLKLTTGTGELSQECLRQNLHWLVPVISSLLL